MGSSLWANAGAELSLKVDGFVYIVGDVFRLLPSIRFPVFA